MNSPIRLLMQRYLFRQLGEAAFSYEAPRYSLSSGIEKKHFAATADFLFLFKLPCMRHKINGNRPIHILIYRLHGWVGG